MYESPYTAWLLHQDKAHEAAKLSAQRQLLYDLSEPVGTSVNEAGLLFRIKQWITSRNHSTQVATDVHRAPAH